MPGKTAPKSKAGDDEISAVEVALLHDAWTRTWHEPFVEPETTDLPVARPGPQASLRQLVREQHRRNFDLWHEEDKARAPGAGDAAIAQVKRRIDALNQQRSDFTERLDATLVRVLKRRGVRAARGSPWNSETPGSAIDRLSILSLRIYHMREEEERREAPAAHRAACRTRRRLLERQRMDLVVALECLLEDLFRGRKVLRAHRHFKMYNDPDLNPVVYRSKRAR